MKLKILAAVAAVALVQSVAVAQSEPPKSAALAAIGDDLVKAYLTYDPTIAYQTGLPAKSQDYFADRSPAGIRGIERVEDALHERLKKVDPARLNTTDGIDYAIAREMLESSIGQRICKFELWNVSHFGWQTNLAQLAEQQDVSTPEARAQALKRWGVGLPKMVDDEIANARLGLTQGYSAPRSVVQRVIKQFDALMATPADKSPFLSLAERSKDAAFAAEVKGLIATKINPALERYRQFLKTEYLPRARESLGVSAHPNGEACYAASLRGYTTLERSGREVYELGQKTVAENMAIVKTLGMKAFGTDDLKTIVARVANDPQNRFKDEAEVLSFSRAVVERARLAMPRAFETVPTQPAIVEPFPEFMRGSGVSSHYIVSPDPTKPGKYMINLDNVAEDRKSQAAITAVHETWPGHHLQLALSMGLTKSDLARLSFNGAYIEGWARYSEALSEELGIYEDVYSPIARRLWPARGMVMDPGLHLFGWTREQVVDYAMEAGRFSRQDAEDLPDRIAMWPGQLTAYDSGGLYIMALRRQAERELGPKFDLKAFHRVVLGSGVVPLAKLRQNVEAWIAAERAK